MLTFLNWATRKRTRGTKMNGEAANRATARKDCTNPTIPATAKVITKGGYAAAQQSVSLTLCTTEAGAWVGAGAAHVEVTTGSDETTWYGSVAVRTPVLAPSSAISKVAVEKGVLGSLTLAGVGTTDSRGIWVPWGANSWGTSAGNSSTAAGASAGARLTAVAGSAKAIGRVKGAYLGPSFHVAIPLFYAQDGIGGWH